MARHKRNKHMDQTVKLPPKVKVQCQYCGEWLLSKAGIRYHKDLHTTGTVKCELCNTEWPCKNSYQSHYRAQHRERKHKCLLCHRKYETASKLKVFYYCFWYITFCLTLIFLICSQ